ncbi:hypothetical protein GGR50DRAFT_690997 [Xylaria sp. CBS 124048]|nr:hypothetical protein GGR50DRAFT_690997 [Xylaria sp. CBS 124048]
MARDETHVTCSRFESRLPGSRFLELLSLSLGTSDATATGIVIFGKAILAICLIITSHVEMLILNMSASRARYPSRATLDHYHRTRDLVDMLTVGYTTQCHDWLPSPDGHVAKALNQFIQVHCHALDN